MEEMRRALMEAKAWLAFVMGDRHVGQLQLFAVEIS